MSEKTLKWQNVVCMQKKLTKACKHVSAHYLRLQHQKNSSDGNTKAGVQWLQRAPSRSHNPGGGGTKVRGSGTKPLEANGFHKAYTQKTVLESTQTQFCTELSSLLCTSVAPQLKDICLLMEKI